MKPSTGMNLKATLDAHEIHNNTKPQFPYRMNRWRYDTYLKRSLGFNPRGIFSGWVLKGGIAYIVYYYVIRRQPHISHWNREGYFYESAHKAPKAVY